MTWWLWMLLGYILVAIIFNGKLRHAILGALLGQIDKPRKRKR